MRVELDQAEMWDGPASSAVAAFEFAKARLTGKKPNLGAKIVKLPCRWTSSTSWAWSQSQMARVNLYVSVSLRSGVSLAVHQRAFLYEARAFLI